MNIAYSSSDSYAWLAGISIISLFENNKTCDEINVFVLDNYISHINKERLLSIAKKYQRNIDFVPMIDLKDLTGFDVPSQKWNLSTYGRLFEASLFPNLDKILHIDCDTLVLDSLENFWNADLTNKAIGGSLDNIGYTFKRDIGLKEKDSYVNAGNLLLNLQYIREKNIEQRFVDYILKQNGKLAFVDQEVINGALFENEKMIFPLRFNAYSIIFYFTYKELLKVKKVRGYYKEAVCKEAVSNPAILHFTSCFLDGTRPWIKGNKHPLLYKFLEYKTMSPWKDEPLLDDNRSFLMKFATKICNVLPRSIIFLILGFLHNVVVRKKLK